MRLILYKVELLSELRNEMTSFISFVYQSYSNLGRKQVDFYSNETKVSGIKVEFSSTLNAIDLTSHGSV